MKDSNLTVTLADVGKMELSGMVHFPIEVGGIKTWSKVKIAPDLGQRRIWVKDLLKKTRAQINLNPNHLKLKGAKNSTEY